MDFEEHIDAFSIRNPEKHNKPNKRKRFPIVPLLLKDVLAADTSNPEYFSTLNNKVQFRQCVLYGRILGGNSSSARCKTYELDDGTGSIEIVIFKGTDRTEELSRLKHLMETFGLNKIKEPLRKIVTMEKQKFDIFNLELGTRVALLGRPTLFRGKLNIVSCSLFVDESIRRDMELTFKDFLIDFYTNEGRYFLVYI